MCGNVVAASLLNLHNNVRINMIVLQRSTVLVFQDRMKRFGTHFCKNGQKFKNSTEMSGKKNFLSCIRIVTNDLGDLILKIHAEVVKFSEQELLFFTKLSIFQNKSSLIKN